jgi:ATP-dependent protease ClpP protease subunit
MDRNHKYVVNRTTKDATMRLYGELGKKVDGDYFAQEIGWLDESVDTIHIHINSPGGNIFQGLSIVGAILAAKAKVITYVDGIAASMAAVIAVAGHRVVMNDFAKLMVHDPYFMDDSGEKVKKLSERDQRAIEAMRNTLEGILKRRCKADIKVDEMMKNETWLTAEEAKTAGMVDEVISTGRDLKNMEPMQMVALLEKEVSKNKIAEMKELTARLKVAEEATEQEIIQAVDQIETEAKAPVTILVDRILVIGRLSGKVTDANEQELRTLAGTDLNAFLAKTELKEVDFKAEQPVRLSDVIAELQKGNKGLDSEKDWDWYQKNDPQALREMKQTDAVKYGKLYKAYWGEELK